MSKPDNMEERLEALRLYEEFRRLDNARAEATTIMPDEEYDVLDKAADAAQEAYDTHPTPPLIESYDAESVKRCGVCEAPLFEDDELLVDPSTGELFLRSALGLPPRPKEEEGQMLPDMAEAV